MKKDILGHALSLPDRYGGQIGRCVKCGSCRAVCPTFAVDREESQSPRGRMALVRAVLDGRLTFSEIYRDRIETCTSCLACEEACASGVPVTAIIQAAKEQVVADQRIGFIKELLAGVLQRPQAMRATAWLAPLMLHYRRASIATAAPAGAGRFRRSGEDPRKKQKVLLFPGCSINYFQPWLAEAAIAVLSSVGYGVVVPEGMNCCGRPLLSLGDRASAESLAVRNTEIFAEHAPVVVITACASCALTFKNDYPTLLPAGMQPPAVLDIHEVLASEKARLDLKPLTMTVTWHDPCHLGRGQGLAGAARRLLGSIPGVTLIEMKEPDRCCGFGGVMRVTHRAMSDKIASEKAKQITATNAQAVVTGCPSCRMQILDGLRRHGSKIAVFHTVELFQQALPTDKRQCGKK